MLLQHVLMKHTIMFQFVFIRFWRNVCQFLEVVLTGVYGALSFWCCPAIYEPYPGEVYNFFASLYFGCAGGSLLVDRFCNTILLLPRHYSARQPLPLVPFPLLLIRVVRLRDLRRPVNRHSRSKRNFLPLLDCRLVDFFFLVFSFWLEIFYKLIATIITERQHFIHLITTPSR